jgi:GNAT superfamily N-acetyltransferase
VPLQIEEWEPTHPRWSELQDAIKELGQSDWVKFTAEFHTSSHMIVASQNDHIVGFLRFVTQEIGADEERPSVTLGNKALIEAKILAFGVEVAHRRRGIGRALQEASLRRARELDCYQMRSHSSGDNVANHQLKLTMGFGVHPIVRGGDHKGVYFIMPLQGRTSRV